MHCPNSGSMKGCSTPGSRVVISRSGNPGRKYPWTLEMVEENSAWIGVNTSLTNTIVHEALENGIIHDFGPLDRIEREVRVSAQSRLDFLLQAGNRKIYLEVKNCSLAENNIALFPDAVTKRGARHLAELEHLLEQGFEAAMIFCIQRADAGCFMPAAAIDPVYADMLSRVHERGVRVLAYQADVQPGSITLARKIPALGKNV